jgi:hypothetical protein
MLSFDYILLQGWSLLQELHPGEEELRHSGNSRKWSLKAQRWNKIQLQYLSPRAGEAARGHPFKNLRQILSMLIEEYDFTTRQG